MDARATTPAWALPFPQALALARTLGLHGYKEWTAYATSSFRPREMPSTPWKTYKGAGFISMMHFLSSSE